MGIFPKRKSKNYEKYTQLYKQRGSLAADRFLETLTDKELEDLSIEMSKAIADEVAQALIAGVLEIIEKRQTFLGFSRN